MTNSHTPAHPPPYSSVPLQHGLPPLAEGTDLEVFNMRLKQLLQADRYVARSDYRLLVADFSEAYAQWSMLYHTDTLSYFCQKQSIPARMAKAFVRRYADLSSERSVWIERHNEAFLNRHLNSDRAYLDGLLNAVDPVIRLDEEQRRVVLTDEDYMLVVAGAGAGKTTTIAAKVKYLVEHKKVQPKQILVISFTNKAVCELQNKINHALCIDCPITTFHKVGYTILRQQDDERKSVVDQGFLFHVVSSYLIERVLERKDLVDRLILFFGSYFEAPYEDNSLNDFFNYIAKADFTTLRGNMTEYTERIIDRRTGRCMSIAHETLRSVQEVRIANFLFMNGIDYVYEKTYPYNLPHSHKPYTPDFTIEQDGRTAYIEHFGITQDGRNRCYTPEQLCRYKQAMDNKIALHRQHKTDLIYTFSAYDDGRDLLEHLEELLEQHGFELRPRSAREVFDKIIHTEENRYISRLVKLICTFIQNFKSGGRAVEDFNRFRLQTNNVRSRMFLDICEQCYYEYAKCLKEKNAVDFEDMINGSARMLRDGRKLADLPDFKYIIVDEYQDISQQRFNLTKELSRLYDAKIIAVGDDWQSIFAYAGSDIRLFTDFRQTFGYGCVLPITRTYRNAQEVIDIAGGFIQRNISQIRKKLVSTKHIAQPVIIQVYSEESGNGAGAKSGGKLAVMGQAVEAVIHEILTENPASSILLLGRYGFDDRCLTHTDGLVYDDRTGRVYSKHFTQARMEFMTVHRAKGLGYDHVVLLNTVDAVYGFPSQVQDDPVLKFVVKDDATYTYAEERRLFYVALTRTRNRVYILTPQQRPSDFVRELLNDYPNVVLRGGQLNARQSGRKAERCPVCGFPLLLRYKPAYGLKLWICSNEPEICDFMTNDLSGGELSILKCDQCRDGFLIVKEGRAGPFLGCTNYKPDRTGCNSTMSREYYLSNIKAE